LPVRTVKNNEKTQVSTTGMLTSTFQMYYCLRLLETACLSLKSCMIHSDVLILLTDYFMTINGRIILNGSEENRVWTGFMWLRIGSRGRLLSTS
jgi:hypothetical protein